MNSLLPCYNLNDWSCDWSSNGFRLPTEAEWEFAARGGLAEVVTTYSGGADPDPIAWGWDNSANPDNPAYSGHGSHPVGTKDPNELGIHDMSGNVEEWCWDIFQNDYYSQSPEKDPRGPDITGHEAGWRVRRGGSWYEYLRDAQVYNRGTGDIWDVPEFDLGLRVVRNAQ
jgi:formylglycine-generating enzyme required for sulfatase activity